MERGRNARDPSARVVRETGRADLRGGVVLQRRAGGRHMRGRRQRSRHGRRGDPSRAVVRQGDVHVSARLDADQPVGGIPGVGDRLAVGKGDCPQPAVGIIGEIDLGAGQAVADARQAAVVAGAGGVGVGDGQGAVVAGDGGQPPGGVVGRPVDRLARGADHASLRVVRQREAGGVGQLPVGVVLEGEIGAAAEVRADDRPVGIAGAGQGAAGSRPRDRGQVAARVIAVLRRAPERIGQRLQATHRRVGEGPGGGVEVGETAQAAQRIPGIGRAPPARQGDARQQAARIVGVARGPSLAIARFRHASAGVVLDEGALVERVDLARDPLQGVGHPRQDASRRRREIGDRSGTVVAEAPDRGAHGDLRGAPQRVAREGGPDARGIRDGGQPAGIVVRVLRLPARAVRPADQTSRGIVAELGLGTPGIGDPLQAPMLIVAPFGSVAAGVGEGSQFVVGRVFVPQPRPAGQKRLDEPARGIVAVRDDTGIGVGGGLKGAIRVEGARDPSAGGIRDRDAIAPRRVAEAPRVRRLVRHAGHPPAAVVGARDAGSVGIGLAQRAPGNIVGQANHPVQRVSDRREASHRRVAAGGRVSVEVRLAHQVARRVVGPRGHGAEGVREGAGASGGIVAVARRRAQRILRADQAPPRVVGERGRVAEGVADADGAAHRVVGHRDARGLWRNHVRRVALGVVLPGPGATGARHAAQPGARVAGVEGGAGRVGRLARAAHRIERGGEAHADAVGLVRDAVHQVRLERHGVARRIGQADEGAVGVVLAGADAAGPVDRGDQAVERVVAPGLGGTVGMLEPGGTQQVIVDDDLLAGIAVVQHGQRAIRIVGVRDGAPAGPRRRQDLAAGVAGEGRGGPGGVGVAGEIAARVALERLVPAIRIVDAREIVALRISGTGQVLQAGGSAVRIRAAERPAEHGMEVEPRLQAAPVADPHALSETIVAVLDAVAGRILDRRQQPVRAVVVGRPGPVGRHFGIAAAG